MKNNINLEASWLAHLEDEFTKPYMQQLKNFLMEEKKLDKDILPHASLWFNALNATPLDELKVVILGQDPYPTIGHAHGLCFSALPDVKPLPKSLINIYKELQEDLGIDNFHTPCLQPWAEQGVLLLNAVLTVEAGKSNAHAGQGWEQFTDKIIEVVNQNCENVVFVLWGAYAQKKGASIDIQKHMILKSVHPSPLSAYRGYWGSKPYSQTNTYLARFGKDKINWQL
jgi:uracil-DNA glycosylase